MKEGEFRPKPEPLVKARKVPKGEFLMMLASITEFQSMEEQIQAYEDAGYRVEFWMDDAGGVFLKPVKKKFGFLK